MALEPCRLRYGLPTIKLLNGPVAAREYRAMKFAVDVLRFVLTGALATLGNFGAVWLLRGYTPFAAALRAELLLGSQSR